MRHARSRAMPSDRFCWSNIIRLLLGRKPAGASSLSVIRRMISLSRLNRVNIGGRCQLRVATHTCASLLITTKRSLK